MDHSPLNILIFAVAAGCGTLARYILTLTVQKFTRSDFPWAIFVVNVLGCFGFGLIWAAGEQALNLDVSVKSSILIGFMGSFTTFSTFIFDCDSLIKAGKWLAAVVNILGQVISGLAAFILAMEMYYLQ